jgi:hypothetical protein
MYQKRLARKFGRLPLVKSLACLSVGPTSIVEQTVELGATESDYH